MRYLIAALILVLSAAGGLLVYRHLTAGPAIVLPIPKTLEVDTATGQLMPGGWTDSGQVSLKAIGSRPTTAGLDVELRPAGKRFKGTPTILGKDPGQVAANCVGCVGGVPPVTAHLVDGQYHWQARLRNGDGISPWKVYRGMINVDTQAPFAPTIKSPTDPEPKQTYHSSTFKFDWAANDIGSGIAGWSYRLDTDPHGQAKAEVRTNDPKATLTVANTGTYYFHARALDLAGNWGPTATFPVKIDITPPGLQHVRFSAYAFNPQVDTLNVSFGVTKAAKSVHVGIYRQSDNKLVRFYTLSNLQANHVTGIDWHGKDNKGNYVTPGAYEVYIRSTDPYGHSSLSGWRDFLLNYRRIVVSLSQQKMTVYDGGKVFLTSLVTTGNKKLPTPLGTYHITAKLHPFTFRSPWPKSSPFYYKPSKVKYAMLFREGGYFIHDAPWRTYFGPGSNAQLGTPGQNLTGTHGCVNVPPDVAARLFAWAPEGTVVEVVP